jgi:TetR/AcrR family transcriptional repressor of nem operon
MLDSATKTALLDAAQELAQTRGFNAFSFQDLARGVGIRTASVHHHFATKADLGREVMARYRRRFRADLDAIDAGARTPRRKLELFADLFRHTLRRGNRLCLCGMLATEYATLPASVQREVKAFYDEAEAWLARVLEQGRDDGMFVFHGSPAAVAKTFFATLEGAMIAARTFADESRLARAARWLLVSLDGPNPPRRKQA